MQEYTKLPDGCPSEAWYEPLLGVLLQSNQGLDCVPVEIHPIGTRSLLSSLRAPMKAEVEEALEGKGPFDHLSSAEYYTERDKDGKRIRGHEGDWSSCERHGCDSPHFHTKRLWDELQQSRKHRDILARALRATRAGEGESEARTLLSELVGAVTAEVNDKGAGGYLLARLTDARKFLASQPPEAGQEAVAKIPLDDLPEPYCMLGATLAHINQDTPEGRTVYGYARALFERAHAGELPRPLPNGLREALEEAAGRDCLSREDGKLYCGECFSCKAHDVLERLAPTNGKKENGK